MDWFWANSWLPPLVFSIFWLALLVAPTLLWHRRRYRHVWVPLPPTVGRYVVQFPACLECSKAVLDGDVVVQQEAMFVHGRCLYRTQDGDGFTTKPFPITLEQWNALQRILDAERDREAP